MGHPSKHDAFESVFIYTKVINNPDVHAINLQNLNKKVCNLDAFLILCK